MQARMHARAFKAGAQKVDPAVGEAPMRVATKEAVDGGESAHGSPSREDNGKICGAQGL
eukprot:CAMPEP_0204564686 /NCGR_PEP_ID=MMETSP0661-20131031/35038_1 /ASSEMBLY_ACC=CAM_ASM_000606 /TAXON_ID=109239 /ORGANISM="Alexandrium margalefi, Strain AMGDE01CS-322" /LENGTH=58 /DNA_ID=CAMNT_0051572357 /DNA_START=34 /DNA_END=208 /DNA_ORIENTATION=+